LPPIFGYIYNPKSRFSARRKGKSALPTELEHHGSKRNVYTVLLVPNEDAAHAMNFRFALWQVITGLSLVGLIFVSVILAVILYTPAGTMLPIKNPELELRYSKELVAINQRMANVMEQLVELRAYNVKLRQALGENVVLSDSGATRRRTTSESGSTTAQSLPQTSETSQVHNVSEGYSLQLISNSRENKSAGVSFPAIFPTNGYLSRGYESDKGHFGLDIAGKLGTVVAAAADGHVIFSGWTIDDGNIVILSHENGFLTFYKHNQSLLRSTGSFVKRGEPIATLGNTGRTSAGPHLHFEIWKEGTAVDPTRYILNLNL
jgi:murein DD-endopeptidase MepM/ murein hydrolase activator NlpD